MSSNSRKKTRTLLRLFYILLVMSFISALMCTGCSTKDNDLNSGSEEKNVEVRSEKEQSGSESVKLTMWTNQADTDAIKAMYSRFQEETGHKLDIVWIPSDGYENATLAKWATGERPDILSFHAVYSYFVALNPRENLRNLSGEEFVEKTIEGILDRNASLDGVVYGAILSHPPIFGMYYNKDVFKRLGLTIPTNSEELMETCRQIKEKDQSVTPIFQAAGSLWPPLTFWAFFMADASAEGWEDQIKAREVRLDDADSPWLRLLKYYKLLNDKGYFNKDILTAKYEDSYTKLVEGHAAMVPQHSNIIHDAIEAFDLKTVNERIGFFGCSEKTPRVAVEANPLGTYYLPKTGDTSREAAALEFIRFMTGPAYTAYIAETGQLPTLKGVPIPDSMPVPLVEARSFFEKYGGAPPIWNVLPGLNDLANWPGELIAGQKSPEQLVKEIQIAADQGARTAGLPGWE